MLKKLDMEMSVCCLCKDNGVGHSRRDPQVISTPLPAPDEVSDLAFATPTCTAHTITHVALNISTTTMQYGSKRISLCK